MGLGSGIQDLRSGIQDLRSGIQDLRSGIQDLEKTYSGSRIQGSNRHPIPDPGSGSATLVICRACRSHFTCWSRWSEWQSTCCSWRSCWSCHQLIIHCLLGYLQGMPLSFYLLKPVKRVTEYPLLMEKLLKLSSADHPVFIVVICSACRSHSTRWSRWSEWQSTRCSWRSCWSCHQLINQRLLWLFAVHAALILPAEAGEASDRVPAAHGEAAEAVISWSSSVYCGYLQCMPLSIHLQKPVKRVTEYPLLKEKLLKLSSADHPAFIVVICRACHSHSICWNPWSEWQSTRCSRRSCWSCHQLIIQRLLLLFAGHATLILPAETREASDRVPAAHGEAAEAHSSWSSGLSQHSGIQLGWKFFGHHLEHGSGSMTFWCGFGSADTRLWLMDPDPAIFVIDLQDANKKLI